MKGVRSLDALVRARLSQWPQRPPGLPQRQGGRDAWLRGRPGLIAEGCYPFLKLPGSNRLRTLPDGLWLNFGGTPVEPFVDIFAIEACGSWPNLLDKRSRFAPSTHSLLAVCPVQWLMGDVSPDDPTPRWEVTGVVARSPVTPLIVPVRDMRVLYALKQRHYQGFATSQVPQAHEYFLPMDVLTQPDAQHNPAVQALVARAAAHANFLSLT
jgi:hypothetical protein